MGTKLILIIGDDSAILLALTQFFNINGYLTFVVNSGFHVFEVLKYLKPDAIVCDDEMQQINGLEFLQNVKDKYAEIPIIMLSSYEGSDIINQAIQLGVEAFLSKPVDFKILLDKVSILIHNNNSNTLC